MTSAPTLSICIPTYNRRELLLRLVREILIHPGSFELCVHVDGSTDGTVEALKAIEDSRLRYSYAGNQGRGLALPAAVRLARGRFVMIFDDDDWLHSHGLQMVLDDCGRELAAGSIGYIYHLENDDGSLIGTAFPVASSNLIALRADHRVAGDKKEVVLANAFKHLEHRYQRVPTSLLWCRLSLDYDIVCRNVVVGRKRYLPQGMSSTIRSLKRRNSYPMLLLYGVHIVAFAHRRYRSLRFLGKALVGLIGYGTLAALEAVSLRHRGGSQMTSVRGHHDRKPL